jgi:hypothetical protein
MAMRKEDEATLRAILEQAGPKGKEIALALAARSGAVEIHLHISGPIVMGAEVVRLVMPMLIRSAEKDSRRGDP